MTATASLAAVTDAHSTRSRVEHFFSIKPASIAEDMGVQARSLCGVWDFTNLGDAVRAGRIRHSTLEPSDCKRCIRIAKARGIPVVEDR